MIESILSFFVVLLLDALGFSASALALVEDGLWGAGRPVASPHPIQEPFLATSSAEFVRVVDGDTIRFRFDGKDQSVRIIGLDTPETKDPRKEVECFGQEASDFAEAFFSQENTHLELYIDQSQSERDKYDRPLRYVSVNGQDYGEAAIRGGFGHEYTYQTPHSKQAAYRSAQEEAKQSERGLWSPDACPSKNTL